MLTSKQRKHLRGLAHPLRPVAHVGQAGITAGVVAAVGIALTDHELIKVRLLEPEDKRAMAQELAAETASELCGLVGHTVILYRRHPEKPKIELPA
ncbi:MAG: ribosome assembly RNA-binding protein YhbY [Deltaproteobacteria bacterium]|nr:ribosome assembly RNA-binding protein YhbY [Deltaproteobacteria bacterium]